MSGDRERSDSETRNAACFLLLVCLCVVLALLSSTFPNHSRNCELTSRAAKLKRGMAELCRANEGLRREIAALREDPFYVEAVARRKYKLIRPGETLIELARQADLH